MIRYLMILAMLMMAGSAGAVELNRFSIPDNSVPMMYGNAEIVTTIHLDNCAAHGLEHSWKYYRIRKTGLSECRPIDERSMRCKDHYGEKEIDYPSGATMELPHGDLDAKVFRRVCKNCKLSEDMRIIHKETWEKTE